MIQHRGSIKKFFIYNTDKSKKKQVVDKYRIVLNLKVMCFYFSNQTNNDSKCLKKLKQSMLNQHLFY